MLKKNPAVALGLPVFNGANYLEEALRSIGSQTYEDFELLISDNGSTDETPEIAKSFCDTDDRFRYHRQVKNLGAARNYNYTFEHTTAPLFKWVAHDDILRNRYLESCVAALEPSHPDTVLAFPRTVRIDAAGVELGVYDAVARRGGASPSERLNNLLGPGDPTQSWLHMCFPVFGLIRREALKRSSLIRSFPRSDTLLLVELALLGDFLEVEDDLFLRREHEEGSVISAESASTQRQTELQLARWFDPDAGRIFPATGVRLATNYVRAVARLPMSPAERFRSSMVVSGWLARNWRMLGGEVKIVARDVWSNRLAR